MVFKLTGKASPSVVGLALAAVLLGPPPARPSSQAAMTSRQIEVVRAAAAPYRGTPVTIVVQRPTESNRQLGRGFARALRAAGMHVVMRVDAAYETPGCPATNLLRVVYSADKSGTINAIAEALIKAAVVADSVTGCPVTRDNELTFVIAGS